MTGSQILLFAFLIGILSGLRSLTSLAVTSWAAHLGWLKLYGQLALVGTLPAVIILTVLALAELVADKLPSTPSRTAPAGLTARIFTGAATGAALAIAGAQIAIMGVLLGAAGAVAGTFGGYQARKRLVKALGTPDYVVAMLEDLVAIGGSLWIVSRF
jgi:uncharacterized membrane protein